MRITPGFIWAATKWLMVIAIAYFAWQLVKEKPFMPESSSVVSFNYNEVNPDYKMNLLLSGRIPIGVDSIIAEDNGDIKMFFAADRTPMIKVIIDGEAHEYNAAEVTMIFYVK